MSPVTLAAVVAMIVGHPFPTSCGNVPQLAAGQQTYAVTWFAKTVPTNIVFAPFVCDWSRSAELQPEPWETPADFAERNMDAGQAFLVAVHEAEHVRYADRDEATTECRALRDLPSALDLVLPSAPRTQWLAERLRGLLWQGALQFDASTPAAYHGGVC